MYLLKNAELNLELPITSETPEIIEKVQNFVANDGWESPKFMIDSLSTKKETIRIILHEYLGKTKVCAKFVPHILTPEQKAMRSAYYRNIISVVENDLKFLKSIVTGDEIWCFQYDSETKRRSTEWKSQSLPQAKRNQGKFYPKLKQCSLHSLIVKVLSTKNCSNWTNSYRLVLIRCFKALTAAKIRRIRPEHRTESSWCLSHDKAPSHTSLIVRRFWAKNNVCILNHPLYSSDLAHL
ncbi:putative DD34D transposase [Trichonephila clavipes]|nr:putative DD34D transposase [Trichonephila clavipes]